MKTGDMPAVADQAALVANLCKALQERHGAQQRAKVLETHISYVLLTGQYAYKIKKAVKLDFLDFSTLELRHFYCQEELRLNRRYAAQLYLDVVAIGGSLEAPVIEGREPAIEYAVKMREFPQENLASRLLVRGLLERSHIGVLAAMLAAFHRTCERAAMGSGHGAAQRILQRAQENFSEIRGLPRDSASLTDLDWLEQWTKREFNTLQTTFLQRQGDGFVRECHGDLHLGNIAVFDDELTFFDCLEFSEDLRWIDVMNEAAFLVMDLHAVGRPDFAYQFLNAYLEETGDYAGLSVLRFYVVYRAMVRAKVALLRRSQRNAPGAVEPADDYRSHVDLARCCALPPRNALILTQGLSGSGKTTVSQGLLEAVGAIRVRSDVERKRLAGVQTSRHSDVGGGLYAGEVTEAAYLRLFTLAQSALMAGYTVIVDATFLLRTQRRMFSEWASAHDVPFVILSLEAPQSVLRERVAQRAREGRDASDADLAVLDYQLNLQEPFAPEELASVVFYDATRPIEDARSAASWEGLLELLERGHQSPPD